MTTLLRQRFPTFVDSINELRSKDDVFSEICDDYEEVDAWLAENCPPDGPPSMQCDDARDLMKELEDEILTALNQRCGRERVTGE